MTRPPGTNVRTHILVTQTKAVARGGGQGSAELALSPSSSASTWRFMVNSKRWLGVPQASSPGETPLSKSINSRGGGNVAEPT
jgi:hypothetical protein